jgi:serine/threonine protein kinase
LLGQGSKKTVYLAHDTLLDRDVAFALIKTEGDEVSGSRIVREAQAMGRLSAHTNIVTVFDLGEHDGQPFMVTELMAAGDLGTLIDTAPNRRIPLSQAIEIARSVCFGLEFAHSNGIVHRDLKPGNVWLAADGTAKIGDFGLAFAVDRPRLTQEGMMVGTLYYMPPEQATGRGVTAKSDLYSLGAMLYEMVTGTPPFLGGDAVTIIGQHVNNVPVPPTWHNPSCPQPLEDLIVGLLEKSPAARPESTGDVLAALDAIRNSMSLAVAAPFDPRNSIEQVALTVAIERPDLSGRAAPDGTVTVLFSDIEASTTMTERLGDHRAQEVLRAHNSIIRSQVATHEGFEVKSLGDGFMLAFSSARRAVQCAIAIQQSLASYNDGHREHPIRVRIGLHAGEVVREVDDFYGKNVILASRIAGQATGGQILVSALLKELTESAGDLRFGDGHDVKLKGLTGTTRIFPVIWDQTGSSGGGVDPASPSRVLKRLGFPAGRSHLGKAVVALALGTGAVVAGLWLSGAVSGPGTARRRPTGFGSRFNDSMGVSGWGRDGYDTGRRRGRPSGPGLSGIFPGRNLRASRGLLSLQHSVRPVGGRPPGRCRRRIHFLETNHDFGGHRP